MATEKKKHYVCFYLYFQNYLVCTGIYLVTAGFMQITLGLMLKVANIDVASNDTPKNCLHFYSIN